jgi:glycosyltransferase involved in cell wall biosynthesis
MRGLVGTPVQGGIDRLHPRLVSGWLVCSDCGPQVCDVRISSDEFEGIVRQMDPRPDTPAGWGFWFESECLVVAKRKAFVEIACVRHRRMWLARPRSTEEEETEFLGRFTAANPTQVEGWILPLAQAPLPEFAVIVDESTGVSAAVPVARTEDSLRGLFRWSTLDESGVALLPHARVILSIDSSSTILDERVLPRRPDSSTSLARMSLPARPRLLPFTDEHGHDIDEWLRGSEIEATGFLADGPAVREILAEHFLLTGQAPSTTWHLAGSSDFSADTINTFIIVESLQGAARPAFIGELRNVRRRGEVGPAELEHLYAKEFGPKAGLSGEATPAFEQWLGPLVGGTSTPSDFQPALAPANTAVVVGLISHESGLGLNSVNSVQALAQLGMNVVQLDIEPRSSQISASGIAGAMGAEIALLHVPFDQLIPVITQHPAVWSAKRRIAFAMWETSELPDHYRAGLDLCDEIWTASNYVAEILRGSTITPVRVVGHAVDVSEVEHVPRASLGLNESDFVVHYSFDANSTVGRKNPLGAIAAFQGALHEGEDARFVLKIRNWQTLASQARTRGGDARALIDRIDGDDRIYAITDELPRGITLGLIAMADCYLSLHRSEGFGYTIAEAIALDTPVICTGYSGNMDYCTGDGITLVPFTLIPVGPSESVYPTPKAQWASPNRDHAIKALREVYGQRGNRQGRSQAVRGWALNFSELRSSLEDQE